MKIQPYGMRECVHHAFFIAFFTGRTMRTQCTLKLLYTNLGCGQSLATNALKHLMDQLEERILQID